MSSTIPQVAPVPAMTHDTIVFLGIELPAPGTELGGYFNGLLKIRQSTNYMTADMQSGWSQEIRDGGARLLESAGYQLRSVSPLFSQMQSYEGVRRALAGRMTSLQVDVYGSLAGGKTEVQLDVDWEVLDLTNHNVVYRHQTNGAASVGGTSAHAVGYALRAAMLRLVADSAFARSFVTHPTPPPATYRTVSANWRRPLPGLADLLTIHRGALNPYPSTSPLERALHGTVTILGDQGSGSAFLITRDGLALTNHHVIAQQQSLVARFPDGRQLAVRVLRSDSAADVALIEVACDSQCNTVDLDATLTADVGSEVYVVGTPLTEQLANTVTRGIVSGVRLEHGVTLIQTDAAVNPGNSGGPILDARSGKAYAIVKFKLVGPAEGLGFGVAVADALRILGIRYQPEAVQQQ